MFLGIDIGTSGVKAIVLDSHGAIVGQGTAALTVQRPQPSWSEQDPDDWWAATNAAIGSIDPAMRRAVRAVGLAGQMHGATLLGDDDRPLGPAILWNDGRSFAECAAMEAELPKLRAISGNIAMPGFTAPKLRWVRDHAPATFAKIRTVLLPKDYVRLCMTGEKASDMSDSAGTLWLDVAARRWSDALLATCSLTTAHMPRLLEGSDISGTLRADVAERWGMAQVPVAAGGGDNAAGAAGVGVVRDGKALLSLGTSGVIFVANDRFTPNPARAVHAFCHCLPDLWHQMSVHLSAAACIDWVARLTGASGAAELFARAELAGPASGPELFLPYLSGERTPHNDPQVRGAFLQLDNDTNPNRLAQAVLEGVAFALADGLDVLREAGTTVSELAVIGGGARSRYWGETIAAAMDTPLVYLRGGEAGPALGAARLAQLAVDGGSAADICTPPPTAHVIDPDPDLAARLAPKRQAFRAAYPRIAPHHP
ncbi:xylulokinase [Polymorphobacter fuscus]|uniref:Xylulose kinase n=1 Tax=Sandarakinorhabdus fusca TaxID=1439888 RepID=A0A7C9GTA5_9SPHN|nr:xylulokinase [Polymorphobacter fuscus]KAB7644090.1 xylulokinase [Polymorphobacter fuscus]MQT18471.1 xylulokinase [Polymorphobacter fuscus]NJC08408.1 xylulokinase [Polymorphobacter fuscus]